MHKIGLKVQGTATKLQWGLLCKSRWTNWIEVNFDHNSAPGVIVEVTEHDNYRIAYKGGVLKDCLGAQKFQIEKIKKAEHYDLPEAFEIYEENLNS
jgi:hypothetical protein